MPPMNTNLVEADGSVSERFTKFYVEIGKGGAGLSCVKTVVERDGGELASFDKGKRMIEKIPQYRNRPDTRSHRIHDPSEIQGWSE